MTYIYDTAPKILRQKISTKLGRANTSHALHTTSLIITIIEAVSLSCNNFTGVIRAKIFFKIQASEETSSPDTVCRASITGTCRGTSPTNGGYVARDRSSVGQSTISSSNVDKSQSRKDFAPLYKYIYVYAHIKQLYKVF